jgi:hypothetical protein
MSGYLTMAPFSSRNSTYVVGSYGSQFASRHTQAHSEMPSTALDGAGSRVTS